MTSSRTTSSFQGAGHFYVRDLICTLCGSLLFYLSFPNRFSLEGYPVLILFFAVGLFRLLTGKNALARVIRGCLFGGVSYALLVNWVCPVDVMGYIAFVAALSIQVIFFSLFYKDQFSCRWLIFLYVPALWVASEFFRMVLFKGFAWTIGHAFAFVPPAMQIADVTGTYGVSFVIILINVALYEMARRRQSPWVCLGVIVCAVGVAGAYGWTRQAQIQRVAAPSAVSVCSVQPNIPPEQKLDPQKLPENLAEHMVLSQACLDQKAVDLILWPEVAIADDITRMEWVMDQVSGLARQHGVSVILGSALWLKGKDYNSAVRIDPKGRVADIYHKRALIPFSEYYPLGQDGWFKRYLYTNEYDFQAGKGPGVFELSPDASRSGAGALALGVAICSEEVYPRLFSDLMPAGPCMLVTLLNDGWFTRPEALMMHAQTAAVQAIAFRVPVVRSSNTGLTGHINDLGQWSRRITGPDRDQLYLDQKDVFLFNVSCKKTKSFYSQYEDFFSYLCLIITTILFFYEYVQSGQRKKYEM
jgi:apolipoprotein N-acyltransferase